jgi:hypothetical protein
MRLLQMEAPFSVVPRWRVSPRRVVPLSFDPLTSLGYFLSGAGQDFTVLKQRAEATGLVWSQ